MVRTRDLLRRAESDDPDALLGLFERYRDHDLKRALGYGERLLAAEDHWCARDAALQLIYGPDHGFDLDAPRTWSGRAPKTGLRWLEQHAEQGDVDAMAYLCESYSGLGPIRRDRRKAEFWARRALARGDTEVILNLGVRLRYGRGLRQDTRAAVRCYRLAAAHGHAIAWHNLALCYKQGEGVRKSIPRFLACARRSAALGHPSAHYLLAQAHWEGLGVRRDRRRARAIVRLLGRRKYYRAANWLAQVLREEKTPAADREALRVLERLRERRYGHGIAQLGDYYHDLLPRTNANLRRALRLYRESIELRSTDGMCCLAQCYARGHGRVLPLNRRAAIKLFVRAYDAGEDDAPRQLREVQRRWRREDRS